MLCISDKDKIISSLLHKDLNHITLDFDLSICYYILNNKVMGF